MKGIKTTIASLTFTEGSDSIPSTGLYSSGLPDDISMNNIIAVTVLTTTLNYSWVHTELARTGYSAASVTLRMMYGESRYGGTYSCKIFYIED